VAGGGELNKGNATAARIEIRDIVLGIVGIVARVVAKSKNLVLLN
jgi:hypothetical protein